MIKLGGFELDIPVLLAPMAGVTDHPYRTIARRFSAPYCVGEMISSQRELYQTRKTNYRVVSKQEPAPRVIQLVGTDPLMMSEAAKLNEQLGAQVIDINMGCPAKKVCKVAAGSALMADEQRVEAIVSAVKKAVSIPVSVKIRTGLHKEWKNAPRIASVIEQGGANWITVHGRSRACGFKGEAEYDTIAEVVNTVSIPVIANGDIATAKDIRSVLTYTAAAAVMIGRASYGRPWIFEEIRAELVNERYTLNPDLALSTIYDHLSLIYDHYGESLGVRIARKHIAWYMANIAKMTQFSTEQERSMRAKINSVDNTSVQRAMVLNSCQLMFDSLGVNNPTSGSSYLGVA